MQFTNSLPNYSIGVAEIKKISDDLISKKKELYDSIASIPNENITFDSVVGAMAAFDNEAYVDYATVAFLQHEFSIECRMRPDVYKVVKALYDDKSKWENLCEEDKRLITKMELEYRREGLNLPEEEQKQLKSILQRISELSIKFSRNVNEGDANVLFTLEELSGLPQDFFENREKTTENSVESFVVTTKYPDLFAVLKFADKEETRKKLLLTDQTRCIENVSIIKELLGYSSHSEYILEDRMAKTISNVENFENDLIKLLEPLAKKELDTICGMKRDQLLKENKSDEPKIYSWDTHYYFRKLKEQLYNIDEEEIKQYFPMEQVTKGIFEIYQKMLGLTFTEVKDSNGWHEGSGNLVGYFWMDLFPRSGKYNHAACWPLRPGYSKKDGSRQYPISAIVANFTKPTSKKPSLLAHDEVVTYFHEFGHVMHNICSVTKWSKFHGTNVESDFVEAPSQMLENWCWDSKVLQSFGKHYISNMPIPESIVENLIKAKNINSGLFNLRQIFFGVFDITIHSSQSEDIDIVKIYSSLCTKICKVDVGDAKTWPVATFGHLMGGYDSSYYGYLWSLVFSADMFESRFKAAGIFNSKAGIDYRIEILKPGGSRDASVSLRSFLGREPNNKAFLKLIGVN
ncbi:hypothetical protein BB560_004369 [Smittium megazygosporum]|uniref:Peptidase M3A/M3B catalytic domain-containing protein n=1 Tax=Smittium megazygosporum TaxID=133381 RepID=A0A2T9Z9F1_9FUNG|nr:hypothetical protein BB560_004369 [Smittium megazygosporum]